MQPPLLTSRGIPERELLEYDVVDVVKALQRAHAPVCRAVGDEFDEAEALALELVLEGLLDGGLCLAGVRHVGGGHAGDVGGGVELVDELAHVHRGAMLLLIAAVRGGSGLGAKQRGRGHLAAGHAVDAVVDEDDREILAAVCSAHGLGQADGGKVAVALIGEHQRLGAAALERAGDGAGPAVGGGDGVHIEIGNGEAAAADALDIAGVVELAQLIEGLADYLTNARVHAAGAEAGDRALEDTRRAGINFFHHSTDLLTSSDCGPRPGWWSGRALRRRKRGR